MPGVACQVMFKDASHDMEMIIAAGARVRLQED